MVVIDTSHVGHVTKADKLLYILNGNADGNKDDPDTDNVRNLAAVADLLPMVV